MDVSEKRLLIAGGAGFIGPHLARALLDRGNEVVVADHSRADPARVPDAATFRAADLTDPAAVADVVTSDLDAVFHLAAWSDPNDDRPRRQFEENTGITYNLLERMDEVGVDRLAFTSSSTVYGEAPRPTAESHGPLEPISVYGASKVADEGLISTYAHSHGIQSWVYRFANIVGPGQRGNVIADFIEKLRADPSTLTILGDGRQEKSYLHVTECVDAMCHVIETADAPYNVFNLGTETTTSVTTVANIVCEVLDVDPDYEYTGGDRGWTGDVPRMRLSIEKLAESGWEPSIESDAAVRKAAEELASELD
ncbi:MAG: NAD-dependent epimerase/dehydratase family protein [Halobacteriaceae archaeon]